MQHVVCLLSTADILGVHVSKFDPLSKSGSVVDNSQLTGAVYSIDSGGCEMPVGLRCAVGLSFGNSSQYGELPTAASPNNVVVTDSSVSNESWGVDVLISAETCLVFRAEAEGIWPPVLGDGNRVVRTSKNLGDVGRF